MLAICLSFSNYVLFSILIFTVTRACSHISKMSPHFFGVVPIALQKKALRQMLSAKSSPPKALQI